MKKLLLSALLIHLFLICLSQPANVEGKAGTVKDCMDHDKDQSGFIDSVYMSMTGSDKHFITGRSYIRYFSLSDHIPILFPEKERTASLIWNGRKYSKLVLHYDTFLDQVVFYDNKGLTGFANHQVMLNKNNISGFTLFIESDTLSFIYFSEKLYPLFNLKEGFYELVCSGECQYIIKHNSVRKKYNGTYVYIYVPAGYVNTGNGFVKITSVKKFVSMFSERSTDIRRYIYNKGINLRKGDKKEIADILKYYESIR